jgi:hypothetical protein
MHDVNILDEIIFEAGVIYIMDRAYLDDARLYRITQASAFFVTRTKKNNQFRRISSHEADRNTDIIADQSVTVTGVTSCNDYPERLRRIVFRSCKANKAKKCDASVEHVVSDQPQLHLLSRL